MIWFFVGFLAGIVATVVALLIPWPHDEQADRAAREGGEWRKR